MDAKNKQKKQQLVMEYIKCIEAVNNKDTNITGTGTGTCTIPYETHPCDYLMNEYSKLVKNHSEK